MSVCYSVVLEGGRLEVKKVLVCNQKGGTGKSFISDEIAFSLERTGVPIAFVDLDAQGGVIHQTSMRDDAVVTVIDTPGALQKDLGDWMEESDLIIIPTRTTSRDIAPLLRMIEIVKARAKLKPILVVLNGWNRWRAASDFRDWLEEQGQTDDFTVMTLVQSEVVVQSSAAGQSVVTYAPKSQAAADIEAITEYVRRHVGLKSEFGNDLVII